MRLRSRRTAGVLVALAAAAAAGVLVWRLRSDDPATPPPADEPQIVARLAAWRPAPLRSPVARLAGYAWASPLTAVGLLLGAAAGTTPTVRDGALLFAGVRGLPRRMLRWRGFRAATLGHVILATDEPGPALLRHELVHVRQAERLGPAFAPVYLAGLVRYGYRNNPLERAAYGPDAPAIT